MKMLQILESVETLEGEGAKVRRLMPVAGTWNHDPIVLWDHFTLEAGLGFPDHPHRGFEGITYLFKGEMQHKDNLGNDEKIHAGGVQRFTAGAGIVHSEMPSLTEKTEGIQLWINLSKAQKKIAPAYQQLASNELPIQEINGVKKIDIIGGDSPLVLQTEARYFSLEMKKGQSYHEKNLQEEQGLFYLVAGEIEIQSTRVKRGSAILFAAQSEIKITATEDTRLMFCSGIPHQEPIHQQGPYVD